MNSIRIIKLIPLFSLVLISPCRSADVNAIDSPKTVVLTTSYAKGADIGWLSEMEAKGKKFYTNDGIEHDLFDVLKSKGINSVRFRIWVDPSNGNCNKADVVAMAIRAHQKGMRIMLDFHYSDSWVDNKSQKKPHKWIDDSFEELKKAVYDHTFDVLNTLKLDGITPEWVQVGNESDDGILYPDGQISRGNGANLAKLFNAGYDAIKKIDTNIKVIAHASSSKDTTIYKTFFDALRINGAHWDIIGLSSYPWPSNAWKIHNDKMLECMKYLQKRYQKPIMIVEVGSSVTAPLDCKNMLMDLMKKNSSLGKKNGLGVFYWEPECSIDWNKYKSGAFDTTGKPTEAMDAFLVN
jgi:arabinogalactan endo-1,4-beta-galactosidase